MQISRTDIRFRTEHELGKYLAAQLYPCARGVDPAKFGAIPKLIEEVTLCLNPEWLESPYMVYQTHEPECEIKMSSHQWLQSPKYCHLTILMANGWDDVDKGEGSGFFEYFYFTHITESEFNNRLAHSILETRQ